MQHIQSTSSIKTVSKEDKHIWESYINNLYNTPEEKFRPTKGRDQNLKSSVDLHGMTIQTAFNTTKQFLEEHRINGSRSVLIVTGKSGKISDELPLWVENLGFIRKCEPVVDSMGECGAYLIHLYANR